MGVYRISYASDLGWANGEAASKLAGSAATFDPATAGIDIFRTPGELRTGFSSTSIGTATVDQTIISMFAITDNTGSVGRNIYAWGDAGDLYIISDAATPSVALGRAVTSSLVGNIVNHKNYVYYPRQSNIGRVGSTIGGGAMTYDDTYVIGQSSSYKGVTIQRPMHSWNGKMYWGNTYLLNYVLGSESTGNSGTTALTFESDHCITALNDNSTRLLIGAGIEPDPTQSTKTKAWLYIWDGVSTNYNDRILFPEQFIHRIDVLDNQVYCFGRNYLYRLVGTAFTIVATLNQRVGIGGTAYNRGQLFWKDNDTIRAIGTPHPQLPIARTTPYSGTGTTSGAILWVQDAKLWSGDNSTLNEFKTGSSTGKTFLSRVISESQQFFVDKIRVYLTTNLASGDDLRVQIVDENAGTTVDVGQIDFATYGAVNQVELHSNQFTTACAQLSSMQIGLKFNAGAVRVREVTVFTTAISQR